MASPFSPLRPATPEDFSWVALSLFCQLSARRALRTWLAWQVSCARIAARVAAGMEIIGLRRGVRCWKRDLLQQQRATHEASICETSQPQRLHVLSGFRRWGTAARAQAVQAQLACRAHQLGQFRLAQQSQRVATTDAFFVWLYEVKRRRSLRICWGFARSSGLRRAFARLRSASLQFCQDNACADRRYALRRALGKWLKLRCTLVASRHAAWRALMTATERWRSHSTRIMLAADQREAAGCAAVLCPCPEAGAHGPPSRGRLQDCWPTPADPRNEPL